MKARILTACLFTVALIGFGCELDQGLLSNSPQPDDGLGKVEADHTASAGLVPGGYYSLAWNWNNGVYGDMVHIDRQNGLGTPIWSLSGQQSWVVDPPTLWGPSPLGIAFDVDGSVYTTIGVYYFDAGLARSRFARIDPASGQVTYIGDPVPGNYCGPDIDSQGNFYTFSMYVPHLGYIHGNGRLYKVDKVTGAFTEIGPVNVEVTDWMDLAFDSQDQLWATTQNKLFKIDTATGNITAVIPIVGVPGDPAPPPYTIPQEVMSIAFDARDVLYGTAMNVEWDTGHGSPVMRISTTTGQATVIGYTEQVYNHGGDIMPTKLRVCHRRGNGTFAPITIAMEALAAHRAHGDFVPGAAGEPCDCTSGGRGSLVGN